MVLNIYIATFICLLPLMYIHVQVNLKQRLFYVILVYHNLLVFLMICKTLLHYLYKYVHESNTSQRTLLSVTARNTLFSTKNKL